MYEKLKSEELVEKEIEHDIDYFFRLLCDQKPQPVAVVETEKPRLSHEKGRSTNNSSSNNSSNRSLTGVLLKNLRVRIPRSTPSKNDDHPRQSPPSSPRRRMSSLRSSFTNASKTSPRSVRSVTNSCSRTAELTLRSYMWDEYDQDESVESAVLSPRRLLCFASNSPDCYMDVHDQQRQLADKNWFVVNSGTDVLDASDRSGIMQTVFYDSSELQPNDGEEKKEPLPPTAAAI